VVSGHLWTLSCYHKYLRAEGVRESRCCTRARKDERGEMKDVIPVVMVDEEKKKPLKIGYMTLYAKFFMDAEYASQK